MTIQGERWWLIGVLLLGAVLRLPSILADLPHNYWHDELNPVVGALRIGTSGLRDVGYSILHGSLPYYLLFLAYAAFFLVGRGLGVFASKEAFVLTYLADPTVFFLIARVMALVAGLGVIVATYLIGRRLFGALTGLVGALFASTSFILVQMTFGKEDGLYVLLVLCGVFVASRVFAGSRRALDYFWAGFFFGLAGATKYLAFLGPIALGIAHFISSSIEPPRRRFDWRLFLGMVGVVIGFGIGEPNVLLIPTKFIAGLLFNAKVNNTAIAMAALLGEEPASWYSYLFPSLAKGIGFVACVLCYIGLVLLLWRGEWRKLVFLLSFPFALTALLALLSTKAGWTPIPYYQLAAVPILLLIAAWAAASLLERDGISYRLLFAVAVFSVLIPNILQVIRYQVLVVSPDTRTIAKMWIESHVPRGSRVLVEGAFGGFVWGGPQLLESRESLARDVVGAGAGGGTGRLWALKAKMLEGAEKGGRQTYDVFKVSKLSAEDIGRIEPDYVVVSHDSHLNSQVMDRLREKYSLEARFAPYPGVTYQFAPTLAPRDFDRLAQVSLLGHSVSTVMRGPLVLVFRRRSTEDNVSVSQGKRL